jgi:hypothetical protein
MADVKKLTVIIDGQTVELSASLKKAEKELTGMEKRMESISKMGQLMGAAFIGSGILGFLSDSVKEWQNVEQAMAKVNNLVKQTGQAAGFSGEQLSEMADALESKSLYEAEDILNKVSAQLLTFTNIKGDNFKAAQQAALDLSAVLGSDLQGTAIQLGKALQDPVAGLTALKKSGVSFSEEQKNVIKMMVETGDIAKAQGLILSEINRQYGGTAEALTKTASGQLEIMKRNWGNVKEAIGKEILTGINPTIESMNKLLSGGNKTIGDWIKMVYKLIGVSEEAAVKTQYVVDLGLLTANLKEGNISLDEFKKRKAELDKSIGAGGASGFSKLAKDAEYTKEEVEGLGTTTKIYTGTLAILDAQIEAIRESQKNMIDPEQYAEAEKKLQGLIYQQEIFKKGGINQVMSDLGNEGIKPVTEPEIDLTMDETIGKIDETNLKMMEFYDINQQLADGINTSLAGAIGNFTNGLVDAIAAGENLGEVFKNVLKTLLIDLTKAVLQAVILQAVFTAVTGGGGGVFKALGGKATTGLIPMASGGIVTGPTPALVGEAGPEAIIPLSKLGGMQKIQIEGKLSGNDIHWSNARQERTRSNMGL